MTLLRSVEETTDINFHGHEALGLGDSVSVSPITCGTCVNSHRGQELR